MPSRRPPSQRDPAYAEQRLAGTVAQVFPGGRVKNAAPVKQPPPNRVAPATGPGPGSGSADQFNEDAWTVTSATSYALTYIPAAGSVNVYVNGLRLRAGGDFTITSNVVSIPSALATGDDLRIWYVNQGVVPSPYPGTYVAAGSNGSASFNPNVSVTLSGAAVAVGDLLVAITRAQGTTVTAPSGWTSVRSDSGPAQVFTRTATSADVGAPTYTFTGGTNNWCVTVLAYRGPTTVADSAAAAGSAGTIAAPTIDAPAGGGILICSFSYNWNGFGPTTNPMLTVASGMTRRSSINVNGWIYDTVQDQIVPATATGTRTATTVDSSTPGGELGQAVLLA